MEVNTLRTAANVTFVWNGHGTYSGYSRLARTSAEYQEESCAPAM